MGCRAPVVGTVAGPGLGLPYTPHAQDGATVAGCARHADPAARRDTQYDLGCLYVGADDVRLPGWDRAAFERDHRTALAFLAERCDRVLTATLPLDLGRPRAGVAAQEANAAIEASAAATQALVLDLRDFGARNLLMPDHVHPTAFGQIAIAERALDLLATHGLERHTRPSRLISYDTTRRGRLRGDLTYAYRHAKISARAALSASASARRRRRRAG